MSKNNAALGFRLLSILILFTLLVGSLGVTPVRAAGECHVKYDAAGLNNGTTWANAYTDLQSALGGSSCTEVWVAAGVYMPTAGTDRAATFQLKSGVALYGGFAGTETLRSERAYMTNVTILSGDIGTPGVNTDNVYHVVTAGAPTASTAILDGFTITAGNSDGTNSSDPTGGGMYIIGVSPNFSSPTLINLTISGNDAGSGGGGGARLGSSKSTLTNITFSNNTSTGGGGGLDVTNIASAVVLTNVTFSGNSTKPNSTGGGGFYLGTNSTATLNNVTFTGNSTTATSGGAITMISGANLTINNSIFWGNTPSGTQISLLATPTSLNINYSILEGGSCPTYSGVTTNITCTSLISSDPLLGTLGNYGGFTQTIPLGAVSPAINGTSSNCPTTDQRRQPRSSPACDIGAYEYNLLPFVISIAGSAITSTSATLEGIVNANNASTTVTFEYGLDISYGSTVTAAQSPVVGVPDRFVTAPISGLVTGTTYHFRVVGQNTNGTTNGSDQTFLVQAPTAVEMMNFISFRSGGGAAVAIRWETVSEISTVGFNIYRSSSQPGGFEKLNQDLIIAKSPGQFISSAYDYQDTTAQPGQTHYYRLEAIGTSMQVLYSAELVNWPYAVFISVIHAH